MGPKDKKKRTTEEILEDVLVEVKALRIAVDSIETRGRRPRGAVS